MTSASLTRNRHRCRPARFDTQGRLLNAAEAIGEIANRSGVASFEGYYNNPEADAERVHDGWYWTGDLAYADEQGFVYFAGRGHDWIRVDGELRRRPHRGDHRPPPRRDPGGRLRGPVPRVGDQVMVSVLFKPGTEDVSTLDNSLGPRPTSGPNGSPGSCGWSTRCR